MKSNSTRHRNPLCLAVALATGAIISFNASAQLEEVIVTAQKRSESAQDVPIAITAFDEEAMKAQQINTFSDMRFAAPNVSFTKANFTASNFMIRGVGNNLVAASGDAGVGVHVNEVPLVSPRLFETEYYDVQQVAVLRGPQGTLYGRNSTGGAVNMITRKAHPDRLEGNLEGQYGNYDHTKLNGAINIPLGDQFGMRFAGLWLDREGYTENLYTGNDVDGREQYSLRGSFNWTGDNTSVDLMISYFDEDSSRVRSQKTMCKNDPSGLLGCLPDSLDYDKPNPSTQLSNITASNLALGELGIFQFGTNERSLEPRDIRKVNSDFDPTYEADETLVTLSFEHQLDKHTIAAVAGYQETDVVSQADYQWSVGAPLELPEGLQELAPETYAELFYDGMLPMSGPSANSTGSIGGHVASRNAGLESYDQSSQTSEQYSLEFRLQSDYDGMFNFLLGGFYMEAELNNEYYVFSNGFDYLAAVSPVNDFGSSADGLGWVGPQFNNQTKEYNIESSAVFGEVYLEFTDTLKLTLGARYTIDNKDIQQRQILLNSDPVTGEKILQPLGADLPIPVPATPDESEWKEWTGRVVLDWAIGDGTLAYASYSRGYKPGGFNPPFDKIEFPGLDETFDPEFVDALEIGVKNTLLDNTLQANFTAFYYDYQGMQISRIVNRSSFNGNTDSEIYGLEAEFIWAPNQNWLINSNIAYLHTEAKDSSEVDPRDPTNGRDDVTLIKDLTNATNCVALIAPEEFPAGQFGSCSAYAAAGLPIVDGVEADMDGNQLQNSPEWSISLGAQYTWNLPRNYDLSMRVDYYWQDEMYARIFNMPVDKVEDWDIWNAQAYLTSPEDRWYVRAFVKNIADEDHLVGMYLSGAASGLFTNVFAIEPRTYGLALGYNF